MKKTLKNLVAAIGICLAVSSCGWLTRLQHTGSTDTTFGTPVMKNSYEMQATAWQMDSICKADTLPKLREWIGTDFVDFETGEAITRRVYMKYWGKTEIVYIVTGKEEPFVVIRRITE